MFEEFTKNLNGECIGVFGVIIKKDCFSTLMQNILQPQQQQEPILVASDESPTTLPSFSRNQLKEHNPRTGKASPKQIGFVEEIIDRLHMDKREAEKEIGSPINKMTNAQANKFINKYKDDKPESPF